MQQPVSSYVPSLESLNPDTLGIILSYLPLLEFIIIATLCKSFDDFPTLEQAIKNGLRRKIIDYEEETLLPPRVIFQGIDDNNRFALVSFWQAINMRAPIVLRKRKIMQLMGIQETDLGNLQNNLQEKLVQSNIVLLDRLWAVSLPDDTAAPASKHQVDAMSNIAKAILSHRIYGYSIMFIMEFYNYFEGKEVAANYVDLIKQYLARVLCNMGVAASEDNIVLLQRFIAGCRTEMNPYFKIPERFFCLLRISKKNLSDLLRIPCLYDLIHMQCDLAYLEFLTYPGLILITLQDCELLKNSIHYTFLDNVKFFAVHQHKSPQEKLNALRLLLQNASVCIDEITKIMMYANRSFDAEFASYFRPVFTAFINQLKLKHWDRYDNSIIETALSNIDNEFFLDLCNESNFREWFISLADTIERYIDYSFAESRVDGHHAHGMFIKYLLSHLSRNYIQADKGRAEAFARKLKKPSFWAWHQQLPQHPQFYLLLMMQLLFPVQLLSPALTNQHFTALPTVGISSMEFLKFLGEENINHLFKNNINLVSEACDTDYFDHLIDNDNNNRHTSYVGYENGLNNPKVIRAWFDWAEECYNKIIDFMNKAEIIESLWPLPDAETLALICKRFTIDDLHKLHHVKSPQSVSLLKILCHPQFAYCWKLYTLEGFLHHADELFSKFTEIVNNTAQPKQAQAIGKMGLLRMTDKDATRNTEVPSSQKTSSSFTTCARPLPKVNRSRSI